MLKLNYTELASCWDSLVKDIKNWNEGLISRGDRNHLIGDSESRQSTSESNSRIEPHLWFGSECKQTSEFSPFPGTSQLARARKSRRRFVTKTPLIAVTDHSCQIKAWSEATEVYFGKRFNTSSDKLLAARTVSQSVFWLFWRETPRIAPVCTT